LQSATEDGRQKSEIKNQTEVAPLRVKGIMSLRTVFILVLAGFLVLCAGLIVDAGFLRTGHGASAAAQPAGGGQGIIPLEQTTEVQSPPGAASPAQPPAPLPAPAQPPAQMAPAAGLSAAGGPHETVAIGSVDKASGYKYQLELDSMGAAIRTATFSEFDTRGESKHEPLVFLSPVEIDGRTVLSMANRELTILNLRQRLSLDRLSWKSLGVQTLPEGGQTVAFEATILDPGDQPLLRLTKTYRIDPNTYLLDSTLKIENLSGAAQKVQFAMDGAVGLEREQGYRMDMRKVVAGFRNPQGQISSVRLDVRALAKAAESREKRTLAPPTAQAHFIWAAAVDRYFAAILVPTPADSNEYPDWISSAWGTFFNPDQDRKGNNGDENIGLALSSEPVTLDPAGQAGSTRTDQFRFYIGPKEKSLFDRDPLYRQLGFVHTIDFGACCCPASIINPLAFAILAVMKWMYFVIPNYGVVIIILVLVMRLVLHPVTRHSQVAMHKMSKLAPRAEEIKKKYANNKAEMNKKLMELYREQGASPITGMLPMFLQMPIWIALWSAIYTSIALRGAPFLPFWITDLSVPDAIVSFPALSIPLVGWTIHSLNLLPILMGVAFYLQQKLMPMQQSAAASNPQMAQQQKIMAIMMPLLFPLMLYNAPSGVNLYIMTSTFAGVIEQYVIKKHIQEKEEQDAKGVVPATSKTGGKIKKKKPKPFYRS
jgi:YidC/Oxa1 family membrane protein insertase